MAKRSGGRRGHIVLSLSAAGMLMVSARLAPAEFSITQIADDTLMNREPVVSETGLVAWYGYEKGEGGETLADVYIYRNGERNSLTKGVLDPLAGNFRPQIHGNSVVWQSTLPNPDGAPSWIMKEVPQVEGEPSELDARYEPHSDIDGFGGSLGRQWFTGPSTSPPPEGADGVITNISRPVRQPSGDNEICFWDGGETVRVTADMRNDLAPSLSGRLIAWQKAKGWPFGWEIMAWQDTWRVQLTTNYYYDMAPKVHANQIVWYGWDGQDYEIFLFDKDQDRIVQVTSNLYDDVSPQVWDGVIAWEGYAAVEADVYMWKDGVVTRLSDNIEDDVNPRIWNEQVVWQGFDGTDYEIYYFDGQKTIKLTSNTHDDINPDIRDGFITWMGYPDNQNAEIFVWDGAEITRLTENDYEDRNPQTAGKRIVWQADHDGKSGIYLAEPR
ncbi:MAG: hypothetical protein JXB04_03085 [Kiritimatiellae bacterium]|nr:hypothetical protein [Kiritimatiellia bacterium]